MRTSGSAYKILEKNMIAGNAVEAPANPVKLPAAGNAGQTSGRMVDLKPELRAELRPPAAENVGQTSGHVVDLTNEAHDKFRHQFRNSNRGSRGQAFPARRQTTLQLRRATKNQETQTDPEEQINNERKESPYSRLRNYIFS
jgi:hypothetical protein